MQLREPETIEPGSYESVPDAPAVFLVHAPQGSPYLARTNVLRRRLKRLLGQGSGASRLLNLRAIAERVEYWRTASQLEGALYHYHLARTWFPDRYLKLLKLRMPYWLRVTLANEFPRTHVTARLTSSAGFYYGPFRSRHSAEQFESSFLDLFQIRRCQEDLAPSANHPGCIYGEMNLCLRPCQLIVTPDEYRSEVARVTDFLSTGGQVMLETAAAARDRLSEEMDFEEAARQHKRLEKIQAVLKIKDELAVELSHLNGLSVAPSVAPGCVELFFMLKGIWLAPVRFGFEVVDGRTVSLDLRLREIASGLTQPQATAQVTQEHAALLARWFYSSWRDADWLPFNNISSLPYRKIVNALKRHVTPAAST
jgi:excinuclease UvrABC nuclease subunit